MNPDYKEELRVLGLTEEQIESILDLNSELFLLSDNHADVQIDVQAESIDDVNMAHYEFRKNYLQSERFIH